MLRLDDAMELRFEQSTETNQALQVIVQASRTPGTITVEASTADWPPPKLPAVRVNIATKKVDLRPTVG